MQAKQLRAGAATSNITPSLGVSLNGGMSDRIAKHIHDELHARVLVLDNGEQRMVLVVCDSCMIPGDVLNQAKHLAHGFTEIPMDWMMISATHTHSAPSSASVFQSEADTGYQEFLAQRISDGVRRAVNNLAPAKIAWGSTKEPTQVHNRRWKLKPSAMPKNPWGTTDDRVKMNPPRASDQLIEPAGPIDPEICYLLVTDNDSRPLALLANYSLHYVGGTGGGHVSADYFGAFADRITQLLNAERRDPPFVAMMSNGTSGDINNIDFRQARVRQQPYEQIKKVAELTAGAVAKACLEQKEFHDWVPLGMAQAQLELGVRLPSKDDLARAQRVLAGAQGPSLRGLEQVYARETMLLSKWPKTIETIVQALRIGDVGIATTPCETFVETGLAIKKESPFKLSFTIELANDYRGYLPTAEHHQLGGYETWRARSSFLAADSEAKVRGKLLELLGQLGKA